MTSNWCFATGAAPGDRLDYGKKRTENFESRASPINAAHDSSPRACVVLLYTICTEKNEQQIKRKKASPSPCIARLRFSTEIVAKAIRQIKREKFTIMLGKPGQKAAERAKSPVIPPLDWGKSRLRFVSRVRTMDHKRSFMQALSILLVGRIVPKFDPKGEGVGSMTDKRNALLLSLIEQGIHYIEEGDAQLFLVVTRSDDAETFDFFLRTAKSEDEAKIESVKAGEVVMIHRFADIFAKMLDLRSIQGGKHDLVM